MVVYCYDATIAADLRNNHSDGDLPHLFCPGLLKLQKNSWYGVTIALHHLYSDGDNTSLTLFAFVDMVVLQVVY